MFLRAINAEFKPKLLRRSNYFHRVVPDEFAPLAFPFVATLVHIITSWNLPRPQLQHFSVLLRHSHTHTHTLGVQHPPQGHQTAGGLTDRWNPPGHMTCLFQERLIVQEDERMCRSIINRVEETFL